MKYNFDEVIDRKGTHAVKVERLPKGADKDSLALWVADMDFACAEPILKALHERIDRKIFGYTMYDADECMAVSYRHLTRSCMQLFTLECPLWISISWESI